MPPRSGWRPSSRRAAPPAAGSRGSPLTNQATDQAGIAEAHLGFGRMDVDVHEGRIAQDREGEDGVAVRTHRVGIAPRTAPSSSRSRTGRPFTVKWSWLAAPGGNSAGRYGPSARSPRVPSLGRGRWRRNPGRTPPSAGAGSPPVLSRSRRGNTCGAPLSGAAPAGSPAAPRRGGAGCRRWRPSRPGRTSGT